MRLQHLFMAACLLIGVFASILYLYGSPWNVEVLRTPQDLVTWLHKPASSSEAKSDAESWKELDASNNDTKPDGEGTATVISGSSSSIANSVLESWKMPDVPINHTEADGKGARPSKVGWSSLVAGTGSESSKTPDALGNGTKDDGEETAPFIAWMRSVGVTRKRVPLVTIADSKYTYALRNLKVRLDKWDRGSDLVVICLDHACAEEDSFAGYRGYIGSSGDPMKHVALIKVDSPSPSSERRL